MSTSVWLFKPRSHRRWEEVVSTTGPSLHSTTRLSRGTKAKEGAACQLSPAVPTGAMVPRNPPKRADTQHPRSRTNLTWPSPAHPTSQSCFFSAGSGGDVESYDRTGSSTSSPSYMTKSNYIALAEANANSIGIMFV